MPCQRKTPTADFAITNFYLAQLTRKAIPKITKIIGKHHEIIAFRRAKYVDTNALQVKGNNCMHQLL